MQPGRSVLAADLDVGESVTRLRPAALTAGLGEWAPRVGDRKLGHLAGRCALDRGHAADDGNDGVPHGPLGPVSHGQQSDDLVGEPEHTGRDGDALLAIGVQERVRGTAVRDQGQLPREVVRVHHPGVHALAAGGRVDVRGVSCEQHAPAPVGGGRLEVTLEGRQPSGLADLDGPRRTLRDQLLNLRERWRLASAVSRVGHDQAPVPAAHRDADQGQPVRAEEGVNRVVSAGTVQRDVGQPPLLRVRLPLERKPGLMAHAAVRTVAADHVARAHLDLPPGGVAEQGVHGVAALGQAHQLGTLLDDAAEFPHASPQQSFGLALREMQGEAVPRAVAGKVQVQEVSLAGVPAQPPYAVALFDERVRQPHCVEKLERPGLDAKRPALLDRAFALVDDAGVDPAGEQLRRQRQAGRPGTDDEHLAVACPGGRGSHASNDGPAGAADRLKNYVGATYLAAAGPRRAPTRPAACGWRNPAWSGSGRRVPLPS
jgi:hypothetical protein